MLKTLECVSMCVCMYIHVCTCRGMWSKDNLRRLSSTSTLFKSGFCVWFLLPIPDLLARKLAAILPSRLRSPAEVLALQACTPTSPFRWIPGMPTQALTLAWQVFYPPSHLLSTLNHFLITCYKCIFLEPYSWTCSIHIFIIAIFL